MRILPYRVVSESAWSAEPWVRFVGGRPEPLEHAWIQDFDYTSEFEFGFTSQVDVSRIRQDTGLGRRAIVAAFGLIDCPLGQTRIVETDPFRLGRATANVSVRITVPAGTLCDSITLERGLLLIDPGAVSDGLTPANSGVRLFADQTKRLRLEGSWSRFPVQAVDFNSSRWASGAAWAVSVTYDDPSDPFMACVRVAVNSEHPAGQSVLGNENSSMTRQLRTSLQTDLVRQLFAEVARDPRFREPSSWSVDGSIGSTVAGIATNLLKLPLEDALARLEADPAQFDTLLQDRLQYLKEGLA